MKKRKIELAVVLAIVAAGVMFLSRPRAVEPESAVEQAQTAERPVSGSLDLQVKVKKPGFSEDARWILSTAADSYGPRVGVEKMWESPSESSTSSKSR